MHEQFSNATAYIGSETKSVGPLVEVGSTPRRARKVRKPKPRAMVRTVRAKTSPNAPAKAETGKAASAIRDREVAHNHQMVKADETVQLPVMGRRRFAECI